MCRYILFRRQALQCICPDADGKQKAYIKIRNTRYFKQNQKDQLKRYIGRLKRFPNQHIRVRNIKANIINKNRYTCLTSSFFIS
jgi:hypothetical protein